MSGVAKKQNELLLKPEHLALVRRLLHSHIPHHRAYAFGSRVASKPGGRSRLKPHSDLDLVLEGPSLKLTQLLALLTRSAKVICRCEWMWLRRRIYRLIGIFEPGLFNPSDTAPEASQMLDFQDGI